MNLDTTSLAVLLLLVGAALGMLTVLDRRWKADPAPAAGSTLAQRAREVVLLAVWFGLATGVYHLLIVFVQRFVRARFIFAGPAIVWMTPVAYVTIFTGLGIFLALIALVVPLRVPLSRLAITMLAWLALFSLLLPYGQLYKTASAVLAAGVAVQVARILDRHPDRWKRTMKGTGLAGAALLAGLALGIGVWRVAAEPLSIRSLSASPAGAPNVLLIVLDTVRAANMSLYGYSRETTPELERWAAESTTFDMTLSTAPWTLKSHATMFSGLYPSEVDGDFERTLRIPGPMIAEMFRDHGYLTGGFVANLLYTSRESGLARGFIHFEDFQVSRRQVLFHSWIAHTPIFRQVILNWSPRNMVDGLLAPSAEFDQRTFHNRTYERKPATEITDAFLDWQDSTGNRPFFGFLNYFDAHQPYQELPQSAVRFESADEDLIDEYDARIAYIDREVGRLLDELQRRGVLDNTIVVITSDHGEQFGEHGLKDHANSLYLPVLHVPLILRYPQRIPKDVRVEAAVTLRDLPATLLDLAGLPQTLPGVSLAGAWTGGIVHGSPIVAELERAVRPEPNDPVRFGPMQSAFSERFHYIRRGDGHEEIYAYRTDAAEKRDLRDAPESLSELEALRALAQSPASN